jgi:hypothetical protein
VRIQKEEADKMCEMKEVGQCGDRVLVRVREDARLRRGALDEEDVGRSDDKRYDLLARSFEKSYRINQVLLGQHSVTV